MTVALDLRRAFAAAAGDRELARLGPGLAAAVRVEVGEDGGAFALRLGDGTASVEDAAGSDADITVRADEAAWAEVLRRPAPPTFHAFTALDLANPRFTVEGDRLRIAQARPVLERLFERVAAGPARAAPPVRRDLGQVRGRYARVDAGGQRFDVYIETAGSGPPVVFLHTAGADSRQFQAQLADVELAARHTLIAFDLPFHGRSMPPRDWDGGPYRLDQATYLAWCAAVLEQVVGAPATVVGGSMGAAMALVLAAERPDLLRGAVAIEPPFRSAGRRNPFQHHVAVHGALHNAAFVRGLMSPESPEDDRRRAAWIYGQGAPGVYSGDLAFYSEEFDGAVTAPRIDARRTPVALLCGTYDYSAPPEDGQKLAALIPGGARIEVMPGLGHFPMCENPDLFRPYLVAALEHAAP